MRRRASEIREIESSVFLARNGLHLMFLASYLVILVTFWWIHAVTGNAVRNEDICGANNGRRLHLQLGEKGTLYARNVTFIGDSSRQPVPRFYASIINSSHYQCSLELVTCASCVIVVIFKHIALSGHHCDGKSVPMNSSCRLGISLLTRSQLSPGIIYEFDTANLRFVGATMSGWWNHFTRGFPVLRSADHMYQLRTDRARRLCP